MRIMITRIYVTSLCATISLSQEIKFQATNRNVKTGDRGSGRGIQKSNIRSRNKGT